MREAKLKLAVVSTHPIQYYAPVFRALALSSDIAPKVFFTWSQAINGEVFDPGFGTTFSWDIPLRNGYEHSFVKNTATRPGSDHFSGIRNPTLIQEISEWGADAILIFGWNLHSHLQAMRYFSGRIPVLFRGDSTLLDPQPKWRSAARRAYLRWVYSHVDVAVAVGQNNSDYFRWCGVDTRRIVCVPHSVETKRFQDPTGEHGARARRWREEMGIQDQQVAFGFAAKFLAGKDPLLLIDAFVALKADAHLVLVGNGELEAEMRKRVGIRKDVHFLPFQNQSGMPAVYRIADVFVLPSRSETWGLALNEAMASGRPVISSSRCGGARDLVRSTINGWVFESGDQTGLEGIMRAAIAQRRDGLFAMGQEALRDSADWSPDATAVGIRRAVLEACRVARRLD